MSNGIISNLLSKQVPFIDEAKESIKKAYKEDDRPWVVGYSGGKDSTVVVQLVFEALSEMPKEELHKKVYVISSDTLVETPLIINSINQTLRRIQDEAFSAQTLNTGDQLVVTGNLQSLVNKPLRAWLSLFSESTNAGNRWEFIARDPPGNIFDIPPQGTIPYSITAKALEPGVYHVHTQLNVEHVGPGLGPGQTIQVSGPAILKPVPWGNVAYQVILIGAGLGVTFATRPWQVI